MVNKKNGCRAAQPQTNDASSLLALAQRLMDQGEYGLCSETLSSILDQAQDHLPALEMLAKSHWKHGQYEAAHEAILRLVHLNPFEPGYFHLKGMVCESLGHVGEAINAYRRCLSHVSSQSAKQAAIELQRLISWQSNTIEQLRSEDRLFRAAYRRDPELACRERGFEYIAPQEIRYLGLLVPPTESAWSRPS